MVDRQPTAILCVALLAWGAATARIIDAPWGADATGSNEGDALLRALDALLPDLCRSSASRLFTPYRDGIYHVGLLKSCYWHTIWV